MIGINSNTTIERPAGDVFNFVNNQENAPLWLIAWLEMQATSETKDVGYPWVDAIEVFGRRIATEKDLLETG